MRISRVALCRVHNATRDFIGDMGRVPVGPEANGVPSEYGVVGQRRVGAGLVGFPDLGGRLPYVHIASACSSVGAPQRARPTDETVAAGCDRLQGIFGANQDPDLDHGPGLAVGGFTGEPRCNDDAVCVLVDNVAVWFFHDVL